MSRIKDLLIKHEGIRLKPYKCSEGKLTIGVGRNLEDRGISIEEALALLENDLTWVELALDKIFPNWLSWSENRKDAMRDMLFNLGESRFRGFYKMIKAGVEANWEVMAQEMLESRWASQVGKRANDLAELILERSK